MQHSGYTMVLSCSLRVFLLCGLLSSCLRETQGQHVDQNTLARIISFIQERYHPNIPQYAVAINIPAARCDPGFNPDANFLAENDPQTVKDRLNNREVYQGNNMIAAVPKKNKHSEYWLMKNPDPDHSLMKTLLTQAPQGCVVFYTYYSPCKNTCLNPLNDRNILTALQMFAGHQGPKAFVYNQIFENDNEGIVNYGGVIDGNVALYRCHPNNGNYECHHCWQIDHVVQQCLV